MIEKGRAIENRQCPKRKTKKCVGCQPCSITTGFAGAGAFSDGKLSLSPDVGGNLPEILGYDKAQELIRESDSIYLKFGADTNVYGVDTVSYTHLDVYKRQDGGRRRVLLLQRSLKRRRFCEFN